MTRADRSKTCVTERGQRALETRFGPLRAKNLFYASAPLAKAIQAKKEWIGRTETMQFQFVTCVPAPMKCGSCVSAPGAKRSSGRVTKLRPRDETAEKIGSSSREVDWFHDSRRRNETPVSYFREHAVNFLQAFACFAAKLSCLPVDIKQLLSGHSDPRVRHVFGQRNCLTTDFFRAYRPAPSMPTSSQVEC